MDTTPESRDAFFAGIPSARWPDVSGDKARPKLRSACDFCHAAKVKCSGEPICARCQSQELPCSYSYAMRAGKPKGSRNKKTLEKQARLRQQYAARNLHSDWQTTAMDLDASSWVDPAAAAGMDLYFSDEFNGATNPLLLSAGESQCATGQNCSITPTENGFTHVDPFLLAEESPPFEPFSGFNKVHEDSGERICSASAQNFLDDSAWPEACNCFEDQMANLNSLYSLHRSARPQSSPSSPSCRFDVCVQRINSALTSCRTFLRCTQCHKDSSSVLLTISSFQLVMRLFEHIVAQQSSTPDSEFGTSGAPKNGDSSTHVSCRLGEYEVSQEEEVAIRRFVVRRALQKGEETLATLKTLAERQPTTSAVSPSGHKAGSPTSSSPRSNSLPSPSSMMSPQMSAISDNAGAANADNAVKAGQSRGRIGSVVSETGFAELSGADMAYLQQVICRSEAVLELFVRTVSRDLYI